MADRLTKCTACDGRGYFRCSCWPADCICDIGDEDCDECGGEGIIDDSYDDDLIGCDCSNYETDLLEGSARCHRCGRSWSLSQDDIAAEIEHQAAYMADEAAMEPTPASGTQIVFGLEQQGHIPTVEAALAEGADWQEIGRRIGWDGETAKAYYQRYLDRNASRNTTGSKPSDDILALLDTPSTKGPDDE